MATRKKKTTSRKVATRKKTAVVSWDDELAKYAQEEAERTPSGAGNTIGIRGGSFSFQGEDLGEVLDVVVIDHVRVNRYFDRPYDPESTSPPACFAVSADRGDMVPVAESPDVQNVHGCEGCWANEFASDSRGRGKACKNESLLAVVSADAVLSGGELDIATLSVSPTASKGWRGFVTKLARATKRPTFAAVCRLSFDDSVDYEKLKFELGSWLDENQVRAVMGLRDNARTLLTQLPDFSSYEPVVRKTRGRKKTATKKKRGGGRSKFA